MEIVVSIGLLLNLVGVILLFRYGMPYRVESKGSRGYWGLAGVDEKGIEKDAIYRRLGWLGLAAIIGGTLLQILAVWCV